MSELSVENIAVHYGEAVAVHEATFDVPAKAILAIVGSNGAGKSSLLKSISGLVRPISGSVKFEGSEVTKMPTWARARAGLVHVPEGRGLIPELTVLETLNVASDFPEAKKYRSERLDTVYSLFPKLLERSGQQAGTLSGGEQQMLAIGRGLMTGPKLLLLDEPSLGLAPKLAAAMLSSVAQVRESLGISIILVEQNVRLALRVADAVLVMETGRIVLKGAPADLRNDPKLVEAYLGKGRA